MEMTPTTLGILAVVLIVGYLFGLLASALENSEKEEEKSDDIALAEDGEEGELAPPKAEVLEPEILAIFERMSGALKLRLDGKIVEYKSDLKTEQRERLLNLVVSLRPWLESSDENNAHSPLPVDVKTPTTPASFMQEKVTAIAEEVAEELSYAKLSMVEQIDRILQKKLTGHPLEENNIQLRASISGGILIQIGIDEYEWIDKIPEQGVQDIIRESIAEWERTAKAS